MTETISLDFHGVPVLFDPDDMPPKTYLMPIGRPMEPALLRVCMAVFGPEFEAAMQEFADAWEMAWYYGA